MDKIRDILNDIMSDIGVTQSFMDCAEIVLDNFSTGGDANALAHVNQMKAMIDCLNKRLDALYTLSGDAWDVIIPELERLQNKLDEANKQRNYYKDLTEKQWAKVDDYSRDVAAQILNVVANPPGGVLTVDILNELYEKYARKEAEVKP